MKSLVGSTNFLVPLRPAVRIRSLLISVREVALEERVRDFLEDIFICRLDDEDEDDHDDNCTILLCYFFKIDVEMSNFCIFPEVN